MIELDHEELNQEINSIPVKNQCKEIIVQRMTENSEGLTKIQEKGLEKSKTEISNQKIKIKMIWIEK